MGEIVKRAYDHRVIDGVTGNSFLHRAGTRAARLLRPLCATQSD
jgi:hypothetical protein